MEAENHLSEDEITFPRIYRLSPLWQFIFKLFAIIIVLTGVSGVLLTAVYLKVPETSLLVMVFMLCLLLSALGLYIFFKVSRYKVIVYQEAIEVHTLHAIRRLSNAQIKGRRVPTIWNDEDGYKRHLRMFLTRFEIRIIPFVDVTELVPIDESQKKIYLYSLLKTDAVFQTWLHQIKDLDAWNNRYALAEIENDSNFGNTKVERMEKLVTVKKVAEHLKTCAILIAIWAVLFPPVTDLPILVLALTPWAAICLMAWSPGVYQTDESRDNIRPGLAMLFFVPFLALMIRSNIDGFMLLHVDATLVLASVCSIIIVSLVFYFDRYVRRRYIALAYLLLISGGYGHSALVLANAKFDHSMPQVHQTMVTKKTDLYDKTYKLMLAPWGEQTQMQSVWVSRAVYDGVATGGNACILFHPGALRMPWYQVVPCIK